MWAKGNTTLNVHAAGNTGQVPVPEDQALTSGSTSGSPSLSGGVARQLRWNSDAVRRLDEEVEWALTSNPTGAAQIAGLLLGESGPITEIVDCHPVFLTLERDREETLAGSGKREFERAMAAFKSNPQEGELSVVGFYRSQIAGEIDLTEEDVDLLRTSFRDTGQVALLMSLAEDRSNARLFLGDSGQALCDFRSSENDSELPRWLQLWQNLSAGTSADTQRPTDATEAADPTQRADTAAQYPLIRSPRELLENRIAVEAPSNRTPIFLLAAVALLAVLVAYPLFKGLAKLTQATDGSGPAALQVQPAGSSDPDLALQVKKYGDDLRLDWNRNAPVIAAASGGMLTIQETNGRQKKVMLDGNLLRTGAVIYHPLRGDVFFRLVILGRNGAHLGEWVASLSSAHVKNSK